MRARLLQSSIKPDGKPGISSPPLGVTGDFAGEPALLHFVGVSGVGNSGKSAVTELLREFESIKVFDRFFEFDIIRVPGGILDLYHHLCEAWSPGRSDYAIKRFGRLVHTMGRDPRWYDVWGVARSSGQRYERVFRGKFVEISLAYLSNFVASSFEGQSLHDWLDERPALRLLRKCLNRLGYYKWMHFDVNVVSGRDFVDVTARYLSRLYHLTFEKPYRSVLINNALEPYCASRTLDVIKNSKLIVVLRDPRDIYVSAIDATRMKGQDQELMAMENWGSNKSFLPTYDVALFAQRHKIYLENLTIDDPRILTVWYEDLVLHYDETVGRIMSFLDLSPEEHARARLYFKPEISKDYVFLWKKYSRKHEVDYIATELASSLYPGFWSER